VRPEAFAPADLTPRLLADLLGIPSARAAARAPYLRQALEMAEINTTLRLAHYLAQIGHETGLLVYRREVWGPTPAQRLYERDPAAPWPVSLEDFQRHRRTRYNRNRIAYSLGNTRPGDGLRYLGRGDIQCTGRANCRALTVRTRARLGEAAPDFEAAPRLLEGAEWASVSGADYWITRRLNALADADDILTLTRRINGGTNGLAHRQALRARCLTILTGTAGNTDPHHDR
jgi:putative chitinase